MFFFFNDTATTEIYTLSLHDALPIYDPGGSVMKSGINFFPSCRPKYKSAKCYFEEALSLCEEADALGYSSVKVRSEEHTSELQSRQYLVCRLLLEKKKTTIHY